MSLRSALQETQRQREAVRNRTGRNAAWRRGFRILRRKVGGAALNLTAPTILRVLSRSWKVTRFGQEHFDATVGKGACLVALWHGRMLPALPLHVGRGVDVLVSPSDDGSLVKRILHKRGYKILRGSTSRSGARSLREMLEGLRGNHVVVITPDGPRGPRHGVNVGLAWLARETGLPILTLGIATDSAWYLKSWDRFTIPRRRARVVVSYGDPIRLEAGASDQELEDATLRVRTQLLESERRAFEHLGLSPDWTEEDEAF